MGTLSGMSWATQYIKQLQEGKIVRFRPRGNSMEGKISSGQLVEVVPATQPKVGDIVLCKVGGYQYLHLISAQKGDRFQISNNKGKINGWAPIKNIYGICTKISN